MKTIQPGILAAMLSLILMHPLSAQTFKLHENGVTITCEGAQPGDTGVVNGVEYTAVERGMLKDRLKNGEDVTKVCTTPVTDMNFLLVEFIDAMLVPYDITDSFNQNIDGWDVSNVTDMAGMFLYASLFNQDIGSWDVSNVKRMTAMFAYATSFNQDIGGWDVSNTTDMAGMFHVAESFDSDISGWDVSNIIDMSSMFSNATSFNQSLSSWDVSSVINMSGMFNIAVVFDQDISGWDVSKVTNMANMFSEARNFNGSMDDWDVSGVTKMYNMFDDALAFNQNISNWDVSNVTTMSGMFKNAKEFNQDIGVWNVTNVTDMAYMFNNAASFNKDIGGWDVSNVALMFEMFGNATSFNQDLSGWCVEKILELPTGFAINSALKETNYPIWGTCPSEPLISNELTKGDIPTEFSLQQNYPNPFNPTTTIPYALPEASDVQLDVFNVLGHKVATLVNRRQAAGNHSVQLNAAELSSGFYFYRIQTGNFTATKKLMLIK